MPLTNQAAFIEDDYGLNRFDVTIAWYVYGRVIDSGDILRRLKYRLQFKPAAHIEANPRAALDLEEDEKAREVFHYLIHPEERELTAPWPTFNRHDIADAWQLYGMHAHRHDLWAWAYTTEKKTDARPRPIHTREDLTENGRIIYDQLCQKAKTYQAWRAHLWSSRYNIELPRTWPRERPDMSANIAETLRRADDNRLPTYAWPGGYTLIALDAQNEVLCMDCANKRLRERDTPFNPRIEAYDTYDEGPDLECSSCGKTIESSYGDPDEELTRVIFRKFPIEPTSDGRTTGGDIIALFPDDYAGVRNYINSFQHIGQHGGADPALIDDLEPATPDEYADLVKELESEPYNYRLVIVNSREEN